MVPFGRADRRQSGFARNSGAPLPCFAARACGAAFALVLGASRSAGAVGEPLAPGAPAPRTIALERALRASRLPVAERLRGLSLVFDAVPPTGTALAIARSAVRANPSLDVLDALELATSATRDARASGLPVGFFAGTLLQESAFDTRALSAAGAVGIAQFTFATALAHGVADPFDPEDAMRGSARLLAGYVRAYGSRYPDPYAVALAAYNAGPGAVGAYGGIPPYPETRAYVDDVYDRWARILRDAEGW